MSDNHNPQGYWTFLVILAFNLLFFVYISFIHPGVEGVDRPSLPVKTRTK